MTASRSPRWLRGTDQVPPSVIGELAGRAAATDGIAAVSGHVLEALDVGTVDAVLHCEPGGHLIGVAVASGSDPGEVVVDPAARRQGHGSALVAAALDRQGGVWAYGDLPAAAAVARRLELVRGRVLLQMRRHGPGPETDARLPDDVRLRTFVPGQDEAAFLGVNARAFAWHPEQGRLDLPGLRAEMAQSWFDPAGFFLAVTDWPTGEATEPTSPDRVVGFHWTKIHPADSNAGLDASAGPIGEVYVLGVDPAVGIRGIGTPLTAAGLDYLAGRGLDTVMLFVEGDNDRARRLYERFGFSTFLTNAVYSRSAAPAR